MYFRVENKRTLDQNTITKNLYSIAFYNVENLFDIKNSDKTLDEDFTPEGKKKWNLRKYKRKIQKLSSVLAQIGFNKTGFAPAIIGLAEVENASVIEDLLQSESLKDHNYKIVHFNSSDERGVEVALLYRSTVFELIHAAPFTLYLIDDQGLRDYTRDVLLVKGRLKGKLVYILVNHWPSRHRGTDKTDIKRFQAALLNHKILAEQLAIDPDASIIIMGDFNDDPTSKSIKEHLVTENFYNPFEALFKKGVGSLTHNRQWHLFDQIILSKDMLSQADLRFDKAYIFDENFLKEWKGKNKGNPFRTYIGKWHQGGYSDHFPIYITLELKA